jgi:hypothetical protein
VTAAERGAEEQPMTLSMQRSDHSGLTPQEIGDRLAIREPDLNITAEKNAECILVDAA